MKTLKTVLIGVLLCFGATSYAQIYSKVSQGTNIIRAKKSDPDVTGSPYLSDKWEKGKVVFDDGSMVSFESLKYDALEEVLVIKGSDEEDNTFTDPIRGFYLNLSGVNKYFKNGFSGNNGISKKTFFEVIWDGKTKVLKRNMKSVIESKGYNTATVTKKIETSSYYYLTKGDLIAIPIKNNEKSVLAALNRPELSKYIKENSLDLKKDEDLGKLLAYYDSL